MTYWTWARLGWLNLSMARGNQLPFRMKSWVVVGTTIMWRASAHLHKVTYVLEITIRQIGQKAAPVFFACFLLFKNCCPLEVMAPFMLQLWHIIFMHILLICICIMKHHLCRPGTICAGKAFFFAHVKIWKASFQRSAISKTLEDSCSVVGDLLPRLVPNQGQSLDRAWQGKVRLGAPHHLIRWLGKKGIALFSRGVVKRCL